MYHPTMTDQNITEVLDHFWKIPYEAKIICSVYLSLGLVIGLVTNIALVLVICTSPTLKTPPNFHLVNISSNNILLSICMLCSILSVFGVHHSYKFMVAVQLFITEHCTIQYFATFASIGIYRNITLSKPTLSLRVRRRIVRRSICISWFVSCLLSLIFTVTFIEKDSYLCVTLTPFQDTFQVCKESDLFFEPGKICMVVVICFFYIVALISTLSSYYTISKELNIIKPKTSNKVYPTSRAMSISSDDTDNPQNNYQIEQSVISQVGTVQVYTIPCGLENEEATVHYQKNENTISFEEAFALQNPILAQSLANPKRQLQATLSNASTQSRTSKIDFTDISPNADLQRFQMMKNSSALRNETMRRDRISVRSATKNSFVMFTGFLFTSLPLIICSLPYASSRKDSEETRIYILLFLKSLFYSNAYVSSVWYLLFSKRVRKCFMKMVERGCPCLFGRR